MFSYTSFLSFLGRKPTFNFQCLQPQSSVDTLPIPGNYQGNTSPTRSRLQVPSQFRVSLPYIYVSWSSSFIFVFSGPAQPGLTAQQRVLHVHCLLGQHGGSWHHPCSGLNRPLRAAGQADLHPYDPRGWIHRDESAAVERRLCQPAGREALGLVPRPDQDLHQRSDAAVCQPELCGKRERGQSGGVGEFWSE